MARLRLTLACWNYDRTRALLEHRISPDGIELNYLNLPVEETFFRMLRHQEFDVSEMSLSSYTLSLFQENSPFIAIPVFPSRMFRHSSIYVHRGSGIGEPKDLIGKRVGIPEYQMTAGVWIRGLLSDEHGVPASSVTYYTGGFEEPGRPEKLPIHLPPEFRLQEIPPGTTLSRMFDDGQIDALYTARMPSSYARGESHAGRLFDNYQQVERNYYLRTKIFPIMHTVVIRREVYKRHPWIAQSLYKAFVSAQREAYGELYQTAALKVMLPWLVCHVEETRATMGEDYWPYGFEPNRNALETFLRYHFEQGLSRRRLQPEELFATEAMETFKI